MSDDQKPAHKKLLEFIDSGGDLDTPEGRKLLDEANASGPEVKGPVDDKPKFIKDYDGS